MQPSKHARLHATIDDSIIETIRKAVRGVGKEAGTFRFSAEEKKALLELDYMYRLQGHKTSENELTRIAVNFILEDYRHSGPELRDGKSQRTVLIIHSVLHRALNQAARWGLIGRNPAEAVNCPKFKKKGANA